MSNLSAKCANSSILPMRRASAMPTLPGYGAHQRELSFEPRAPTVRRQTCETAGIVVPPRKECQTVNLKNSRKNRLAHRVRPWSSWGITLEAMEGHRESTLEIMEHMEIRSRVNQPSATTHTAERNDLGARGRSPWRPWSAMENQTLEIMEQVEIRSHVNQPSGTNHTTQRNDLGARGAPSREHT